MPFHSGHAPPAQHTTQIPQPLFNGASAAPQITDQPVGSVKLTVFLSID
jgi:hypothetical protein